MTDKLRSLLIKHEGKRNTVYLCPAGKWTIGIGHNIDAKGLPQYIRNYLDEHGQITDEMVDVLFAQDVMEAMRYCMELFPQFNTFSDNRKIALIDFLFNVGYGTAKTFISTRRCINFKDWEGAALNMEKSKWYTQVGKRGPTIVNMIREG